MSDNRDLHKLLEDSEDQLFQQIVNRMEGIESLEERPGPEPSPEALARFEAELDKLTVCPRPRYRRLFRVAILAAILIAAFLIGANAWLFFNWIEEKHDQYTQIQLGGTSEARVNAWVGVYLPTYIPNGYFISDCFESDDFKSIEYQDSAAHRFTFYQYGPSSSIRIDTEDADKTISKVVNGQTAYLFQKSGLSTIYWNGGAAFSIEFDPAIISEDEVLKIASGIQWIEK